MIESSNGMDHASRRERAARSHWPGMRQLSSVSSGAVPDAAVRRILARPADLPPGAATAAPAAAPAQWSRRQIDAEVDDQQAIVVEGFAVPRRMRVGGKPSQARTPDPTSTAPSNGPIASRTCTVLAAQPQQIAMQRDRLPVPGPLFVIAAGSAERLGVVGIGKRVEQRSASPALRNWLMNSARPARTAPPSSSAVIGEIHERRRGGEFLPLKEHRRARRQQPQRGHRAIHARARELMHALAAARRSVGDLIVVLEEGDESAMASNAERRRAAPGALPRVALSLVEKSPFRAATTNSCGVPR